MNISEIVARFVVAAAEHGSATDEGDYKRTNKAYKRLHEAYCGLKALGKERETLLPFLEHQNSWVRVSAASWLLKTDPDRAEPVLEDLSHAPGYVGLNAEVLLEEWRKGKQQDE